MSGSAGNGGAGAIGSYEGRWYGYTDDEFTQPVRFEVVNDVQIISFVTSRDYVYSGGGCGVPITPTSAASIQNESATISLDVSGQTLEIGLTFDAFDAVLGTIGALTLRDSCRPSAGTFSAHRFDHEQPSRVPSIAGTRWSGTMFDETEAEVTGTIAFDFSSAYTAVFTDWDNDASSGHSWDQTEEWTYIVLSDTYSSREFWGKIEGTKMSGVSTWDSPFENPKYTWEVTLE